MFLSNCPESFYTYITFNLGAIDGLLRVQDTYGLKSLDIARGHFGSMEMRNQTRTLPKLTSQNCFEIGYQAYRKGFVCCRRQKCC